MPLSVFLRLSSAAALSCVSLVSQLQHIIVMTTTEAHVSAHMNVSRREMSEAEIEKMQSMMSGMKPEDMQKWAGRAQTVAKVAAKPAAVYNKVKQYVSANTVFALLVLLCAILFVGHLTDAF
eukprot:970944-Pleurochrysis_carterae.AAC.1